VAITAAKTDPHWNYLLTLDRDLVDLSRYIEFDERNLDCFSIEMARLLFAAASEADVVCKQLCREIDANSSANNIHRYRDEILARFPKLPAYTVKIARFGLTLRPWDEWGATTPQPIPIWWTHYNKVKHERSDNFEKASLKNVLNSVAGLFVLLLYYYSIRSDARMIDVTPVPLLLGVDDSHFGGTTIGDHHPAVMYEID
jgi:hypothetical protein